MASLLDLITGGKSSGANNDLNQALAQYNNVQLPTSQQLTLPELQQYVVAGIITPAQAQAYLQQQNAYSAENVPQTGTAAQVAALNQLSQVANAGATGTPVEQAQIANTIEQMNQNVAGEEGAIQQAAEARGTPAALYQSAMETQDVGQAAQQAYLNSLNAQSNAYQTALNAMTQGANVGSGLQSQQNTQANTVAQAQNAMQQFNAANQQNAAQFNANLQQQANVANTQNAQNVSNANTQTGNERTAYNVTVPQQQFQNQMQLAQSKAGVNEQQANQATQQGQQQAGLLSGLIGAGATLGGDYMLSNALPNTTTASTTGHAHGGIISGHEGCYHDGGICMERGGMVPGQARVPGDSERNDIVKAHLSPGEAVIPRTAVQQHLPAVLGLISGAGEPPKPPHPHDVATVLSALRELRQGVA